MHAYYEIETTIPSDHRLHIQLPDIIPAGYAKITVSYESKAQNRQTADLIAAIKNFRVTKALSAQDIKSLCEEGRA